MVLKLAIIGEGLEFLAQLTHLAGLQLKNPSHFEFFINFQNLVQDYIGHFRNFTINDRLSGEVLRILAPVQGVEKL